MPSKPHGSGFQARNRTEFIGAICFGFLIVVGIAFLDNYAQMDQATIAFWIIVLSVSGIVFVLVLWRGSRNNKKVQELITVPVDDSAR